MFLSKALSVSLLGSALGSRTWHSLIEAQSSPDNQEQCADTGAIDPLAEGVKAAYGQGFRVLGSKLVSWGMNQYYERSIGCYCPNEKARPMPGRWAPRDPAICQHPNGWPAWQCYCPSLFSDYLKWWGEGAEGTELFKKLATTADNATSPCMSECGAAKLDAGYPVVEVDNSETSTEADIGIAWRTGMNKKFLKLPPNQCAGKCIKPKNGKKCHQNGGRAMNRITRLGPSDSQKCCAELFMCTQDELGDWEKPGMMKAIHTYLIIAILEYAVPEEARSAEFDEFVRTMVAEARAKYQAALPKDDVRSDDMREDEFLSIFFGSGEPPKVVQLNVPTEFGEHGSAFLERPLGAAPGSRMQAMAELVVTIVSGIATNMPWDVKSSLVARWDEDKQTLIVTLPVPMQGQITSSSKVPFKLHASDKLKFQFRNHKDFAEVHTEGLWIGPLQGVDKFINDPGFRTKLDRLVDLGLGGADSVPNDDRFDLDLDNLAREADRVYKDLAKGPWKKSSAVGGPEEQIAEWIADTWSLMGNPLVKQFLDDMDFPSILAAVASAMPYEITQMLVVQHPVSKELQMRAKRRSLKKRIQEVPAITAAQYDALVAAGDRKAYKTMALPKNGKSGKTAREVALYLSKGQSALSWLSMFTCDSAFPGFDGFPTDMGKSKVRYPEDDPRGGSHELINRMLTLCNDASCSGSKKGRLKWLEETEDFVAPAEAPDLEGA